MSNLLDRLVGVFSPDAGLRRLRARELLTRAYEGASPRDGWRPRRAGAGPNTDHAGDATTLRNRARSLYQNVPYITAGVEAWVANHIGTGITPRSLSPHAAKIDALYDAWGKQADADGIFDINGMVAAAERACYVDGECLLRRRDRRPEDGLAVPLQFQLLEIDWLDSSRTGTNGPNTITNGIEYDPIGRRVAYWLWDQHPGEMLTFKGRARSYPVPADRVFHFYTPTRPGQSRGISMMAPVISRVRDLSVYEDAELARKNLETRLSVIASGDVSALSMSETEAIDEVRKTGELGTLNSGSITQIPGGNNLTIVEPKAAPGYVDYVKYDLHLIAAGMGVTYEMMTGDMREINFSSARVRLIEFRRRAEQRQWVNIIPGLMTWIWTAFIDTATLAGKLPRADYAVDWSTTKWDYVNPEQDVKADLAEISGGLSTISEKLRRRGYKPELVFSELKTDFDRLQKDGTLALLMQLQTGQAPTANAPAPTTPGGAP